MRSETRRRSRESGQAMVEFALILLPLMLLIVGVIQFGIGLNYWLDLNRLANQGARWAVVNEYPGCPRTGPNAPCATSLQHYIACEPVVASLKPTVSITFPAGASADNRGDPVRVSLETPYDLAPISGLGTITLRAETTMRIEQDAGRYLAGAATAGTCP